MTGEPRSSRYPGSPPFSDSEIDRLLFRGRADEARRLTDTILSSDLVVVYGVSGTGKTSLLQAGVFHRLRHADLWPVVVRLNDPARSPLDLVADRMVEQAEAEGLELVPARPRGNDLWELLAGIEVWRGDVLLVPVLVLDQFEELFTLDWAPDTRAAFIEEFGWVTRGHRPLQRGGTEGGTPAVKTAVLIREDSLGELEALADHVPHIMRNRFRLVALDLKQAEEAIRGPARLVDDRLDSPPFEYADDAVALMIDFLRTREERGEPVKTNSVEPSQLQIICQYVEDVLAGGDGVVVSAADLGGTIGLNRILREFYRRALASLADEAEAPARELCETGLINTAGRRLSLEVGEIEAGFGVPQEVLDRLVEQRLLRAEARTGSRYYELSHDSLLRPILDDRAARLRQAADARRKRIVRWVAFAAAAVFLGLVALGAQQLFFEGSSVSQSDAALFARTVTGNVTSLEGGPLGGVRVEFHATKPAPGAIPPLSVQTDQNGDFTAVLPEGGDILRARFVRAGYREQWWRGGSDFDSAEPFASDAAPDEMDVELAGSGTIIFSVTAGAGTVTAELSGQTDDGVTVTRPAREVPAEGRFDQLPTGGSYTVSFRSDGFVPETVTVALGLDAVVDLNAIELEQVAAAEGAPPPPIEFSKAVVIDRVITPGIDLPQDYRVANPGSGDLTIVSITDDGSELDLGGRTVLAPGEEATFSSTGKARAAAGCGSSVATLTYRASGGDEFTTTATDPYCVVLPVEARLFFDEDRSGLRGDEEAPIPGVRVTLAGVDSVVAEVTGAGGRAGFFASAGTYTLGVDPVPGADATTPVTVQLTIDGSEAPAPVLFGFRRPLFEISGIVYHDANANGERDAADFALSAPVDVQLCQASGCTSSAPISPTVRSGAFGFDEQPEGNYDIIVAPSAGFLLPDPVAVAVAGADVTGVEIGLQTPGPGLFCRDLATGGFSYAQAYDYWVAEGMPPRMDADLDGVPCETVYPAAEILAHLGSDGGDGGGG